MTLKPGKKIIINKAAGAGASKSPASPRKRPSVYLPPQEDKSRVWVLWVIVALVIVAFVVAVSVGSSGSQSRKQARNGTYSPSSPGSPRQEERLWMGDYMKRKGIPAELRARQEQVRQHESRRDIVQ